MATKTDVKIEVVAPAAWRPIVKLGLKTPFQVPGFDVFTYVDVSKHRAEMTAQTDGVLMVLSQSQRAAAGGPVATKHVLVPWGNITYVFYGEAV